MPLSLINSRFSSTEGQDGSKDESGQNEVEGDLEIVVQDALDEGRQYFQVKLSKQNANGNGVADGFIFTVSDISLEVSYN